jgi:hypothetical protein
MDVQPFWQKYLDSPIQCLDLDNHLKKISMGAKQLDANLAKWTPMEDVKHP